MGSTLNISNTVTDLGGICQQAIEETQRTYPEVDIYLDLKGNKEDDVDAMRMQQVLANLVRNAVQHGGEISVTSSRNEGTVFTIKRPV